MPHDYTDAAFYFDQRVVRSEGSIIWQQTSEGKIELLEKTGYRTQEKGKLFFHMPLRNITGLAEVLLPEITTISYLEQTVRNDILGAEEQIAAIVQYREDFAEKIVHTSPYRGHPPEIQWKKTPDKYMVLDGFKSKWGYENILVPLKEAPMEKSPAIVAAYKEFTTLSEKQILSRLLHLLRLAEHVEGVRPEKYAPKQAYHVGETLSEALQRNLDVQYDKIVNQFISIHSSVGIEETGMEPRWNKLVF